MDQITKPGLITLNEQTANHVSDGQRNFDHLLINIVDDLSGDLIHTVQAATHQILDISTQFLESDVSNAIEDFHALYEKNVELDSYKEAIGKNIDDMIHYIQDHNTSHDHGEELPDLSNIDSESLQASRLTLSHLQKDMEALARLDTGMKEQVIPILHNMQFEDQLSANVQITTSAWKTFIEKTDCEKDSTSAILEETYKKLTSVKLRELFCQHVLRTDLELGITIPRVIIEDCIRSLESEEDYFTRMQVFSASVLQWSTDDSAASVDLIFEIIKSVEQEAEQAGDFSEDAHYAFSSLKEIAQGLNNTAKRESTKIMISLLQDRMTLDNNVQQLVNPVMIAMQFQDRIRQNMENLSKTGNVWIARRKELSQNSGELDVTTREEIGLDLLNQMTMESERIIIKKHIPETPISETSSGDDLELF